jgi:hypothetical protein
MGKPRRVPPVKLFVGLLSGDADLLRRARQLLNKRWGPIDAETDPRPFDQTNYYLDEMGPNLLRQFICFEPLIAPHTIADVKHETNAIEARITEDCLLLDIPRPVNIDPGYLDVSKVVLATTKDAGHRICIGGRMFAEVTLQYRDGAWQPQPWTYPDYRTDETRDFFARRRDDFLAQRRARADAAWEADADEP